MVLAELGRKITSAFTSLCKVTTIDQDALDSTLKKICMALLEADVNVRLVKQMRENALERIDFTMLPPGANKRRLMQSAIFAELMALVDPKVPVIAPSKRQSNVILLVGLQGAGKTTTCVKLAHWYQRRNWKCGIVCADTFRAGAFDQIKQNATKACVPFYGSYIEVDPVCVAQQGVEMFKRDQMEIIIVDTSGRHKQADELFEEMLALATTIEPQNIIFVLDATIGQGCEAQATAFKAKVDIGSIILTKLDGHAKGGGALSAIAATNSPIIFIGTGEHIDDLQKFEAESFISKMLGMGDVAGFVTRVNEMSLNSDAKLFQRLKNKQYSFRDLYEQLLQFMKLGPISELMSMIPGLSRDLFGSNSDEDSKKCMKTMMCIMDSLTEAELDHPDGGKLLTKQPTRITRVARGAGLLEADIRSFLRQYNRFATMLKKVGGIKALAGDSKITSPVQMAKLSQQVLNAFGPNMGRQIGGQKGLQQMMRNMK